MVHNCIEQIIKISKQTIINNIKTDFEPNQIKMKGTIKWFSEQKGHGYLLGEDSQEYHIHIKEVQGTVLPKNGDIVEFEKGQNQKGLLAKNLTLLQQSNNNVRQNSNDDRVTCTSCGKKYLNT